MKRQPKAAGLISHYTLAQQAFRYLSQAILSGELRVGDRLIETELSERLGISRAPIREALAELERQGLAYSVVRRGTFVRTWSKKDLWEVAVLRGNLESLAAELAAPHLTESDIRFLEHSVAEMTDADQRADVDLLMDLDAAFHERVLERCGHERLQQLLHDMRLQIRIFRIMTRPTDHISYPELHQRLVDALRTRNPLLAQQTARAHVMDSAQLALAALPDDGTLVMPVEATNR